MPLLSNTHTQTHKHTNTHTDTQTHAHTLEAAALHAAAAFGRHSEEKSSIAERVVAHAHLTSSDTVQWGCTQTSTRTHTHTHTHTQKHKAPCTHTRTHTHNDQSVSGEAMHRACSAHLKHEWTCVGKLIGQLV